MFDLPPPKLPDSFGMVLKHIDALRRSLNKLERQVLELDMGSWQETFGEIRYAWIDEEIAEIWAAFWWQEHKSDEAFYGKEVCEELRRRREERKRGGEAS